MADGTAHYAEKVGDTQHMRVKILWTFYAYEHYERFMHGNILFVFLDVYILQIYGVVVLSEIK